MALLAVVRAISNRVDLGFDGCARRDLNVSGITDADNGAFVLVEYPVANSEQLSFGAPGQNIWREEGAFRVVIVEQRGVGVEGALAWADKLARLFRGIQILEPDCTIHCWAPSSPILDESNEDGSFFLVSFAVPYSADIIG